MYCKSWTGGRCCICARQTLRVHSTGGSSFLREMTSWPLTAILKAWRQIKNPTLSINVFLFEEQSYRISSRSDLKRQSLGYFWRGCPTKKNKNNQRNKMSSVMRPVPDPKIHKYAIFYKILTNRGTSEVSQWWWLLRWRWRRRAISTDERWSWRQTAATCTWCRSVSWDSRWNCSRSRPWASRCRSACTTRSARWRTERPGRDRSTAPCDWDDWARSETSRFPATRRSAAEETCSSRCAGSSPGILLQCRSLSRNTVPHLVATTAAATWCYPPWCDYTHRVRPTCRLFIALRCRSVSDSRRNLQKCIQRMRSLITLAKVVICRSQCVLVVWFSFKYWWDARACSLQMRETATQQTEAVKLCMPTDVAFVIQWVQPTPYKYSKRLVRFINRINASL